MQTIIDFFSRIVTHPVVLNIAKAGAGLVVLFVVYKTVARYTLRLATARVSRTTATLIEKVFRYCFLLVAVMYVFKLFGINIDAVLGAAGIAGVAIGFASQTSVSNIISGFFLLSEKTINSGDFVDIDGTSGTVDSINMLSVKLKTLDNQMVRVPNETIIKSNIINYSVYAERRFALYMRISYDADLGRALEILKSVPQECGEIILTQPEPLVFVDSFDTSGIVLVLAAWFKRENLFAARNTLFVNTKRILEQAGIPVAYPQFDLHFADVRKAL